MKTPKFMALSGLILVLSFFTMSCGDDEASPENSGQMTAIVDGTAWETDLASASFVQNIFNISGFSDDETSIIITLDGLQLGNYTSNATTANVLLWQPGAGALGFSSQAQNASGQVTITDWNEDNMLVSGTFSFTAVEPSSGNSVEVTEGVFTDVKYTDQTPEVGDNFLKTKIDGQEWKASSVTGIINAGVLTLNGTNTDASKTVAITMPADTPMGIYEIMALGADYMGQYNADASTFMTAIEGNLEITNHDQTGKVIEGEFNFNAGQFGGTQVAILTEGSFKVSY